MMHCFNKLLVYSFIFFIACNQEEKKPQKGSSDLFLDYKVSAEEGRGNATIILQFRKSEETNSVALEEGSQVSFDGQTLVADSARLSGFFYETQRPLTDFEGEHLIVYTDKMGQTYEVRFLFAPIQLKSLPEILHKKDLILELEGSKDNGNIQVTVTDTSFSTTDINEYYNSKGGQIVLEKEALKKLANGPIALELFFENLKPLPNGRLTLSYIIRRDLEIKD
jgi:hypothetical protein